MQVIMVLYTWSSVSSWKLGVATVMMHTGQSFDTLTVVMLVVITSVSTLVHLYSFSCMSQ